MLHTVWFIIIAIFWIGFFVLESFDFGVGMLYSVVGRTDAEQGSALETIGPHWDGNEVWLIVAGAGTFAAFPSWYATMFSALYLPLFLVLLALMARGVGLEFLTKRSNPAWRSAWRWALILGSLLVPLLLGVGLGDLLRGLPIDKSHEFTGNFLDLLTPFGLWTGVTFLALSVLSGASYLAYKTAGPVRDRATAIARPVSWISAALVLGYVIWSRVVSGGVLPDPVAIVAVLAALGAVWLASTKNHGWVFAAALVAVGCSVAVIFIDLYPNVMVSSTNAAYNLTVSNASANSYALKVMTVVAAIFAPLVLAYQAWSYWVFRGRVTGPPTARPVAVPSDKPPAPAAQPAAPAPT